MDLQNTTKIQLSQIIEDQRSKIDQLNHEIKEFKQIRDSMRSIIEDKKKEIIELKEQNFNTLIQNITDIKTFQNFLFIFSTETMTHNEKKYLAGKVNTILQNLHADRVITIQMLYLNDENLPF